MTQTQRKKSTLEIHWFALPSRIKKKEKGFLSKQMLAYFVFCGSVLNLEPFTLNMLLNILIAYNFRLEVNGELSAVFTGNGIYLSMLMLYESSGERLFVVTVLHDFRKTLKMALPLFTSSLQLGLGITKICNLNILKYVVLKKLNSLNFKL